MIGGGEFCDYLFAFFCLLLALSEFTGILYVRQTLDGKWYIALQTLTVFVDPCLNVSGRRFSDGYEQNIHFFYYLCILEPHI